MVQVFVAFSEYLNFTSLWMILEILILGNQLLLMLAPDQKTNLRLFLL